MILDIVVALFVFIAFITIAISIFSCESLPILDGTHKSTCPGGGIKGCNCGLDHFYARYA